MGKPKLNRPDRLHGANLSRASLADALALAASLNNIRGADPCIKIALTPLINNIRVSLFDAYAPIFRI
jgi:hypothetical protein